MAAWLKQWIVISKSINRKTGLPYEYVVSLGTDGHWECSCANWTFQKGGFYQTTAAQFIVQNVGVTATPAEVAAAVAPVGRKFRD